jgi:hypothetical protein
MKVIFTGPRNIGIQKPDFRTNHSHFRSFGFADNIILQLFLLIEI